MPVYLTRDFPGKQAWRPLLRIPDRLLAARRYPPVIAFGVHFLGSLLRTADFKPWSRTCI